MSTKVSDDDIKAAAMMVECGCDRGWVAEYIGLSRQHMNKRIYRMAIERRARVKRCAGK